VYRPTLKGEEEACTFERGPVWGKGLKGGEEISYLLEAGAQCGPRTTGIPRFVGFAEWSAATMGFADTNPGTARVWVVMRVDRGGLSPVYISLRDHMCVSLVCLGYVDTVREESGCTVSACVFVLKGWR
jgi:hypothetical protein